MVIDPSFITVGNHGDVQLRVEEVSKFVANQAKAAPLRAIQGGCDNKGCSGSNDACANAACH